MNKILFLIRGISGSGKTTLANILIESAMAAGIAGDDIEWNEADHYFIQNDGSYKWDSNHLDDAHMRCFNNTKDAMQAGKPLVIVSNTFTRQRELRPYRALGETFGYQVQEIICNGRFDNVHNVPPYVIQKQLERFQYV